MLRASNADEEGNAGAMNEGGDDKQDANSSQQDPAQAQANNNNKAGCLTRRCTLGLLGLALVLLVGAGVGLVVHFTVKASAVNGKALVLNNGTDAASVAPTAGGDSPAPESWSPTTSPSVAPASTSSSPSLSPSDTPTGSPTVAEPGLPSHSPTIPNKTITPSHAPSLTTSPSTMSYAPTTIPTHAPTLVTAAPTSIPTQAPTFSTKAPTVDPGPAPTIPATIPSPSSVKSINIEIEYLSDMTAAEHEAFESAKAKWQSIITGDIPSSVTIPIGLRICEQPPATRARVIDDILIFAEIRPLDGPGSILGQAGPCGFDSLDRVRVGLMSFDKDDTALMHNEGILQAVILHEMGHVLGLGTMWDYYGLISPASVRTNIQYFGAEGNAGNVDIGGRGNALVEDVGNVGTVRGHWKESVYQNELMTGYISGSTQPLSALTARSLRDLGYTVDASKADPFTIPSSGRRLRGSGPKKAFRMINDIYTGPLHYFETDIPKPGRERDYQKSKMEAQERRKRRIKQLGVHDLNS